MTEVRITEIAEQPTAGIRERVLMSELTAFFARAFTETMTALRAQGLDPVGPPFGKYYGMPDDTVDIEAGFPVGEPIAAAGAVVPGSLPGGRVAEAVHVGPYDTMDTTYAAISRHLAETGLVPGPVMWEHYLTDPDEEPDPARWRTRIVWPVSDSSPSPGS